jgi:hypothetical protein
MPNLFFRRTLERTLRSFLFFTLLSYPFFVKYLALSAYQMGFLALLGLLIVVLLLQPSVMVARSLLVHPTLVVVAVCYCAYLGFLGLASVMADGDGYLIGELGRAFIKPVVGILFLLCLSTYAHRSMMDSYSMLMSVVAVSGVVLVVGSFLGLLSPIGAIQLPASGLRDTGVRDVYALGFAWGALSLPGGGRIVRLQSFADEPGTLAFALLVALVWSVYRRWAFRSITIAVAVVLTWSVGAVVAGIVILSFYSLRRSSGLLLGAIVLSSALSIVAVIQSDSVWSELISHYALCRDENRLRGNDICR